MFSGEKTAHFQPSSSESLTMISSSSSDLPDEGMPEQIPSMPGCQRTSESSGASPVRPPSPKPFSLNSLTPVTKDFGETIPDRHGFVLVSAARNPSCPNFTSTSFTSEHPAGYEMVCARLRPTSSTKQSSAFAPASSSSIASTTRWKLVILFNLFGGRLMRFSDLERAIPDISQKMSTE